jgi:hypothetical protein
MTVPTAIFAAANPPGAAPRAVVAAYGGVTPT